MGSICATQTIPTIKVEKGDTSDKGSKRASRSKRYSQTSFEQQPAKPLREWTPPQPTPMPKGIVLTPEPSQLTVDDVNGARLSVSTHASGSDALTASGSSLRSSSELSSSLSTSTTASKITEKWKAPPRLESLKPEMRALLLGRLEKPDKLMPRPKVLHLKVIAPANNCMKERLSLWGNALKPLRLMAAEKGFVVDIQDDMWSSLSLDKNYFNFPPSTLYEMPQGVEDTDSASIWAVDAVLVILTDTIDSRLPDCLDQEEFTLINDGIQEEDMARLFSNIYANVNDRQPPIYTLQRRFMIKQNWRELHELIVFMRKYFSKANKDVSVFCSNYHSQLNAVLGSKSPLSKRTVVVKRSLTRVLNLDEASYGSHSDFDLRLDNTNHRTQMDKLKEAVERNCDPDNVIQLELPLRVSKKHKHKFDSDLSVSLQNKMSVAVKGRLTLLLDDVIAERQAKERKIVTGVPTPLVEELVSQAAFHQRLLNVEPLHTSGTLTSLQDYVSGVSETPVIVLGDPGWGLSTMASQLRQHCVKTLSNVCVLYRSLGISPDTRTLTSTLMSMQQQLDVILGDRHVKNTKQDVDSTCLSKNLLRDIANRSSQNMHMVIILDGVFLESDQLKHLEVMTLADSLPCNTRLIVLTSDPGVARVAKLKMRDAFSIKACAWDKQLVANIFSKTVTNQNNAWLNETQNAMAANAIKKCPLPLFATVAGHVISDFTSIQDEKEEELPATVEGIVNKLFDVLETHLPTASFSAMMSHLCVTAGGTTTWEMNDLLSVNDAVLLSIYSDEKNPPIHRAPSILWKTVSFRIQQFLHVFVSDKFYSFFWASGTVSRIASRRYLNNSAANASSVQLQHREIGDHFQGRWADKKKPYPSPEEEIELLEDRFIMPQPDGFGSSPNVRKLLCLPHHAIQSKSNDNQAKENFILNISWIINKLSCTSIIQVLLDLEEAKALDNSSKFTSEIKTMQYLIYHSFNLLSVRSSELCKIVLRHLHSCKDSIKKKESKGGKKQTDTGSSSNNNSTGLFKNIETINGIHLSPLDEALASFPSLGSPIPSPVINAILPVDEKASHLAVISKTEGEIRIVSGRKNEAVRTLTALAHPSTLQMLDATRAVVLCNRELCVVDLDEGALVTKLRGVLNLRMPYFGLQNKDRVVVLSRDRMVVNVMDIRNGSIVASFKAGETRFLDSLIISKNGRIVVCGDETQKPFPLLVWSLEQNKLLHDIRMSQHEFLTKLADVTHDGLYLACACKEINATDVNFVTVYDLKNGQLFRKFKMAAETTALALCSNTLTLIVALDSGQLVLWDIGSGNKKYVISGVDVAIDTLRLSASGHRCLSSCAREFSISSHTVCLWDLDKGQLLGIHTFQSPVTATFLTPEGDTIWVGVKGCLNPVRLVLVGEAKGEERGGEKGEGGVANDGKGSNEIEEEDALFGDASRAGDVIQVLV